jgi:hypothetical protein
MKNTNFDSHDIKKCCETKLGIVFRKRKEFNGWVYMDDKKFARITVPKGRKSITPGTYKSMANQLKINTEQFDNFLECPLDKKGYEAIMINHSR